MSLKEALEILKTRGYSLEEIADVSGISRTVLWRMTNVENYSGRLTDQQASGKVQLAFEDQFGLPVVESERVAKLEKIVVDLQQRILALENSLEKVTAIRQQ